MLVTLEGRRLYYDLLGEEGRAVVCLVHALAADSGLWAEQVPALLGAGYGVLRVDLRGHGGSDPAPGDYRMDELADDLAALVGALGLDGVHYVGLSLGGMCGQALALNHGKTVRSLVICDALPAALPNAAEVWGPRVAAVRQARSVAPIAADTMRRWLTDGYKARHPGRWRQIHDTVATTTPDGYAGCAAAIQSFSFVDRLPSLKMPVLVVCGTNDPGVPPSEGRRIAGLIPGANFEAIPEAMHLPNVEHPDLFNRVLLDWLQNRAPRH
jgi:3-oxoadipate enol-lactonase